MRNFTRLCFALILLTVLNAPVLAQTPAEDVSLVEWSRMYGDTQSEDIGIRLDHAPGGGYIVFGNYMPPDYFPWEDFWLIKTNDEGEMEWNHKYAAPGCTGDDIATDLEVTPDGYVMAGYSYFDIPDGMHDGVLIKTDLEGNVQWSKIYGDYYDDEIYDVEQTTDGGYIAVGDTENYGTYSSNIWLFKTDSSGNQLWYKTFGETDSADTGRSVRQTSDGGYILVGEKHDTPVGWDTACLIKTDANGNLQWEKLFSQFSIGLDVLQTNDGGYVIAGESLWKAWLAKTDGQGELQWEAVFAGKGFSFANRVKETLDGGYVFVGGTDDGHNDDLYLVKVGSTGTEQWSKIIDGSTQNYAGDVGNDVLPVGVDGYPDYEAYIVVGHTDFNWWTTKTDLWLLKVAPKPPVIIIPGIMGTYLNRDEDRLWITSQICLSSSDAYLDDLALCPDGSDLTDQCMEWDINATPPINIQPDLIMEEDDYICLFKNINAYGDLITYLLNNNYSRDPGLEDLFTYPYDWRKPIAEESARLETDIAKDFPKVDIVAHSMGGLLARQYANEHPGKVRRIIFAGSPHAGAPAAYDVLATGNSGIPSIIFSQVEAKKLARNWPSAHTLLPTPRYISALGKPGFLDFTVTDKDIGLFSGWPSLNEAYGIGGYPDYILGEIRAENSFLSNEGLAFHSALGNEVDAERSATIIGTAGRSTIGWYHYDITRGGNIRVTPYYVIGDRRVPLISATSIQTDDKYYVANLEHGGYYMNADVNELAYRFLSEDKVAWDTPLTGLPETIRDQNQGPLQVSGLDATSFGPARMQVYDSLGNVDMAEVAGDGTIMEIPLSNFNVYPQNEAVALGKPDDYKFKFFPVESGTFSFFINYTLDGTAVFSKAFMDIPLNAEASGQIIFTEAGSVLGNLWLDTDGDGEYDDEEYVPQSLPVIISTPVTTANESEQYTYAVLAIGAEGDTLTYSLPEFPAGMTVDPSTGLISWTAACGPSHVIVRVTGGTEEYDEQEFDIDVSDYNPPQITAPPDIVVERTGNGQPVDLGTPTASDTCCEVAVVNDAPELFYLGDTIVTWTATDCNSNIAQDTQTVTVQETTAGENIGVVRNGVFYLDTNGNRQWDEGVDLSFAFGLATDTPLTGDWNGDGNDEVGIFRDNAGAGFWRLDTNGNHIADAADVTFTLGSATDTPIIGDWNGDGIDEIGRFRGVLGQGVWYLDMNGDHIKNAADATFILGLATDTPIIGDWNADGTDEIGIFRNGGWYLDMNGNHTEDAADLEFSLGSATDTPIIGDWNADGTDEIGLFRDIVGQGGWYLDMNGNHINDAPDITFISGQATDMPITGKW